MQFFYYNGGFNLDNNENIQHFKKMLYDQKEALENTLLTMRKEDEELHDRTSELSNYDNHPAELGTTLYQTEMVTALKVHEESRLNDIDTALNKIEDGTYGKCENCGKDISNERLEAIPFVKFCMDCQTSHHKVSGPHKVLRPNEEKVLGVPFGQKYQNERQDDGYESIDYLNDVLKYGSADTPQDMGGYNDYDDYYTNEADFQGIVDPIDNISNEMYKRQLP